MAQKLLGKGRKTTMKKTVKAIICAASAAVMCAAPATTAFVGLGATTAITAEAAGFKSYVNNGTEVSFKTSMISSTANNFEKKSDTFETKIFNRKNVQMFEKQRITFSIKPTSNLTTKAQIENILKNARVNVRFSFTDKVNNKKYTATHDYKIKYYCNDSQTKRYICTCEFLSYGTDYTASINNLDNSGFEFGSFRVSGKSDDFYKVETFASGGERIYGVLPKANYSKEQLERWGKDLCLLANSLKELTGNSVDNIFIIPDEYIPKEYIEKPETINGANTKNYVWTSGNGCDKNALITIGKSLTNQETKLISGLDTNIDNPGIMNKYLTHEVGHAYALFPGDTFAPAYYYTTQSGAEVPIGDDNYTNVRALTAMNNCTQLKDYRINDNRLYKLSDLYNSGNTTFTFYFAQKMIKYVGFNALEKFYKADNALSYNSEDVIDCADAINKVILKSSIKINADNAEEYKEYLQFVNGLKGLCISKNPNMTSTSGFMRTMKEMFTIDGNTDGYKFLKSMITNYFGSDLKI